MWMCSYSYISSRCVMGNDMIYIWNYLHYDRAPAGTPSVGDSRVYGQTADDVRALDKLPSLILLVFDLKTDAESLYITRGHRL